jgi:hypothetical protein
MTPGWTKKFKGSRERGGAFIYTHPNVDRAIVQNHNGYSFNGEGYPSLVAAIEAAEATIPPTYENYREPGEFGEGATVRRIDTVEYWTNRANEAVIAANALQVRLDQAEAVLHKIAAYDDAAANAYLRATGSYRCFDEPGAVEMARVVLEGWAVPTRKPGDPAAQELEIIDMLRIGAVKVVAADWGEGTPPPSTHVAPQFLSTEDGEFNGNVGEMIVPPHCSGYSFVFEPGVLHVKKDGSGHIVVNEEDFVLEDDRDCEGGSIHWIARMAASEITALRDFLNGAPRKHMAIEDEIASVVQSVNEWDDRTSPEDYPEHLLITSEELADLLRNFAASLEGKDNG